MSRIGRKLYYNIYTGQVIVDTGELDVDGLKPTTVEEDFKLYSELKKFKRDSIGCYQLEYGQFKEDFAKCNGVMIDLSTNEVKFSYPDNNSNGGTTFIEKPLTVQVEELRQQNDYLMLALVELAEKNEQEKTKTQLALAEMASFLIGGEK